ncbi:kelch-like protein 26 [Ornithodoros turicata]|uniref:Kelch-like protein diablo n=1 Tax=Ornithodoros turicata TaxID=34597 RepID=A0A2R5LLM2_9ACAR
MKEIGRRDTLSAHQTVQFESPSHTGTLLNGLNSLRSRGQLLDVTLIAGGREFHAHRAVLAACSDYFRAMFTDPMRESTQHEICLNGVSAQGLRSLLDYAYTSKLALSLANIQDVLSTANHVGLTPVVEACSSYLQEQLDLENCVDVATIAETYSLRRLRKRVYRFICAHLRQFSETAEFQRLSANQLEHLLACDFPVNCPEGDVLSSVLNWVAGDLRERLPHARELLSYVCFSEIPTPRLAELWSSPVLQCLFPRRILPQPSGIPPPSLVNTRGMELVLLKVGGFGLSGVTNEITYYLPSAGRWKYLTSIPHVEQCNFGTAVLGNELYVVGGCFNQSLHQENVHPFGFRYNALSGEWSTMAPMHRERCRFSLCVARGHLYAIGGVGEIGNDVEDEDSGLCCELYDPRTDAWLPIVSLPGPRTQHAGVSWGPYIFVSGGLDGDSVLHTLLRYDTRSDVWEAMSPMRVPRADHSMVCYGDQLYLVGGWYEDPVTSGRVLVDAIEAYDITNNVWAELTTVPTPRYHTGVSVLGSWLYTVGGFHSDTTFDRASGVVERYDLEGGRGWEVGESYPQDTWEHTCCALFVPRCRDDLDVISDKTLL